MQRGYLVHCMPGWRAVFCVLDNFAPHRVVVEDDDSYTEGRRGFGWVCRLHDWAGGWTRFNKRPGRRVVSVRRGTRTPTLGNED